MIIKEADPWTIMCAYNRLNGVYCSQNPLLLDQILRKEWKYDGVVMSDWNAVHDRPAALRASLELQMPYTDDSYLSLKKAYDAGEITDAQIDRVVLSLLKLVDKIQKERDKRKSYSDTPKDRFAVAKKAAEEAVTLLKNKDGILPIQEKKVRKIAVIGGCAETPFIQGGGSANVTPSYIETPLEEIRKIAGKKVDFSVGYTWWPTLAMPSMTQYRESLDIAAEADVTLVFVGETDRQEIEGEDRTSIRLHPSLERLIQDIAHINPNTVVVVEAGSAIDMSPWIDTVKGVVFGWYTGSCGGSALADILFGRVNPSGKLSETFPLSLSDTPTFGNYPGLPVAWYGEGEMIGYRYYDSAGKEVLFPFGFGLSYTTFAYSKLSISSDRITKNKPIKVSFHVKNTGKAAGKETVQLYIGDIAASVRRPEKELKRFEKVELQPGEEKTVTFSLIWDDFTFYSTIYHDWTLEEGNFEILVGSSSRDIQLSGVVRF